MGHIEHTVGQHETRNRFLTYTGMYVSTGANL